MNEKKHFRYIKNPIKINNHPVWKAHPSLPFTVCATLPTTWKISCLVEFPFAWVIHKKKEKVSVLTYSYQNVLRVTPAREF